MFCLSVIKFIIQERLIQYLDSVYFTAWTDPDLGAQHADDFVGSDTLIKFWIYI